MDQEYKKMIVKVDKTQAILVDLELEEDLVEIQVIEILDTPVGLELVEITLEDTGMIRVRVTIMKASIHST